MPISIDSVGAAYHGFADSLYAADLQRPIQSADPQSMVTVADEEDALVDSALDTMALAMAQFVLHFGQQELQKITAANEAKLKELNEDEG